MAGCLVGAVLAADLSDRIGRKNTLLVLAPITYTAFVGIGLSRNIWYITTLRIFIGICDGAAFTVLPMYIGEIVDPDIRGFLSSVSSLLFICGTLVINILGPVMSIFLSSMVSSSIPVIHFVLLLCSPESPYYYVKKEKYQEAERVLRKLKGENQVKVELDLLKEFITKEKEVATSAKLKDLFVIPSNRRASWIYFLLVFANRVSGKSVIMFYTTTIFLESGSTINASLSSIIYSAVEVVIVFLVTFFIVDRFGKRVLMIMSGAGCSITVLSLSFYFFLKESGSYLTSSLNWLPLTCLVLYNVMYSSGLGFGLGVYLSELFPMNVKAKATCLGEITTVVLGTITSQFFQMTYIRFGFAIPFLCFGVFCGISVIFFSKIVPETKGKSLAEIQEYLVAVTTKKSNV